MMRPSAIVPSSHTLTERSARRIACAVAVAALALPAKRADAQMTVQMRDRVVTLDAAGYARGNAKAPVWMVEFADFGCGYCEKFARETVPLLDSLFIRTGKVYWKFVPFTIGMFPNSGEAALGAICASEQGKFFQMHDVLYERRKIWSKATDVRSTVARYAGELKLDAFKFASCVKSPRAAQQLAMNNAMAETLRIRGTPTFFINGEVIPGALPTDVFVQGMNAVVEDAQTKKGR